MKVLLTVFQIIWLIYSVIPWTLIAEENLKSSEYRLVLPTSDFPISYDPLDADLVNNSYLMKLRYFTPIEVDHEDKFRSSVLKSFDYDNRKFQMTWKVRSDLKYADGTAITPNDIVLAIKRMAIKRSQFPVLNTVKGLKEWSVRREPLGQDIPGLKLVGDTITIDFDQNVTNPFFQFSLSLFAIQTSRCFDLKTTKLICDLPPVSGYYDYLEASPKLDPKDGKFPPIRFALRKGFDKSGTFKMPPRITLEYSNETLPELVKKMDGRSVATTLDSRLTDEFINQFRSTVDIKRLPKTAIWYLLLNPNFEAFKSASCRRIFANKYRDLYGARVASVKVATKSFSSPIMPGYLTNEEMLANFPKEDPKSCLEVFKKNPVRYKKMFPFWDKLIEDTMVSVGMPTSGVYKGENTISSIFDSFVANDTAVLTAYVSFWPLDLASGFDMFFSPGMHSQLKYLLEDNRLSSAANKLFKEPDPSKASDYYKEINLMLYSEAQLNALSYFGGVYISKTSQVNKLPVATSEPNPWHLFGVK